MSDELTTGSVEQTQSSPSTSPVNQTPSASTEIGTSETNSQPSTTVEQPAIDPARKVNDAVMQRYLKQQEQTTQASNTNYSANAPEFRDYTLNQSQANTYGQQQSPELQTQQSSTDFDASKAAQFAPPKPGEHGYDEFRYWRDNFPEQFEAYQEARQRHIAREAYREEIASQRQQEQFEYQQRQHIEELDNTVQSYLSELIGFDAKANPDSYTSFVDVIMPYAIDDLVNSGILQKDPDMNDKLWDPATGMYCTPQEVVAKTVKVAREFFKQNKHFFEESESPQPSIPANNFVTSGNIAARQSSNSSLEAQMRQAAEKGDVDTFSRLQEQLRREKK